MIIKMEVCECRKNVRETGDGRVTDRPILLYGQFVSRRTGKSQYLLMVRLSYDIRNMVLTDAHAT
jgi:hypothetical protein